MASYVNVTNTLDFAMSFKPSSAFPLDFRQMFGSKAAAEAAAAKAEAAGSTNTTYYYGMPLTVFENDEATMYVINGDNTLKEVGKATYGDDKTIVLSAETGALSLKDFGVQYYAYHEADEIIASGDYAYPDNMPADANIGAYVQISTVWYQYDGSAWSETAVSPKTTSYYSLVTGWKEGLEPKVIGNVTDGFSLAWYEPSSTTVEGLQSIVASVQTTVDALNERVTENETDIATNAKGIADEKTRAEAAEKALAADIATNTNAISTLNGDATVEGSVRKQVNDAIAAVVASAPEDFDTLKEISDWITTHGGDAAKMNSDILANATAITALEQLVGALPEGAQATDVMGYIAEAVAVETARAEAAEKALSDRLDAVENATDGLGTAAYKNVEEFATAAQGQLADSAVQTVESGANGYIKVDGNDVKVYEAPIASTSQAGMVKADGTSITVNEEGVASVQAVDAAKVTGLDDKINGTVDTATANIKEEAAETYVAKTDVVTAAELTTDVEQASDLKVASEKALVESLTWKTSM